MTRPAVFFNPVANEPAREFVPAVVPSDPDSGPPETAPPPKTDRGVLFNPRTGESADSFKGTFRGASCFLVCGGPSADWSPLQMLARRGLLTASVNNVGATVIRPDLWFCCDAQWRFSEAIWRDPGVMKFAKLKYTSNRHKWAGAKKQSPPELQGWNGKEFVPLDITPEACPNVWGYLHTDFKHHPWDAAKFFTNPLPSWGSSDKVNDPKGDSWHKSVMLVAFWLLRWMGVATIYLVGCDFRMREDQPYAFDEIAKSDANNGLFAWLNDRFAELVPHLPAAGLEIINCTVAGKLKPFPRMTLEDAIDRATAAMPKTIHTRGQYK